MATAYGINFYGTAALETNAQKEILNQIEILEKKSEKKEFPNEERLFNDCIKALSNFITITWNENGSKTYIKGNVSQLFLELIIKFSKKFNKPIDIFVIYRTLREWITNRIFIIESNNKNTIRVDGIEYFSLLLNDKKDHIFTQLLDCLYSSLMKWSNYEKIIKIVLEVLKLLTYSIEDIKPKVVNNFTVQILKLIEDKNISGKVKMEMIEFVQKMTGTNAESSKVDVDTLIILAENDGIAIILKELMNNVNAKEISNYKPLLEALANLNDNNKLLVDMFDELLTDFKSFNKLGDE